MTDQPRHPQDRDEQLPLFDAAPNHGDTEPDPEPPAEEAEVTEQLPLFASWDPTPPEPHPSAAEAPAEPAAERWDAEPATSGAQPDLPADRWHAEAVSPAAGPEPEDTAGRWDAGSVAERWEAEPAARRWDAEPLPPEPEQHADRGEAEPAADRPEPAAERWADEGAASPSESAAGRWVGEPTAEWPEHAAGRWEVDPAAGVREPESAAGQWEAEDAARRWEAERAASEPESSAEWPEPSAERWVGEPTAEWPGPVGERWTGEPTAEWPQPAAGRWDDEGDQRGPEGGVGAEGRADEPDESRGWPEAAGRGAEPGDVPVTWDNGQAAAERAVGEEHVERGDGDVAAADWREGEETLAGVPDSRRKRISGAGLVIGVLLALLGFSLVVQVKSNSTDAAYASLREGDLLQIMSDLDGAERRLEQDIASLEAAKRELASGAAGQEAAQAAAKERADDMGILAGTLPAQGPGVQVVLTELTGTIKAASLLNAVQELRGGGAEAILIDATGGSVRVIASTSFVDDSGGINVDGTRLTGPYTILAIGEPDTLSDAVQFAGGVVPRVKEDGGNVIVNKRDVVEIKEVRPAPNLEYARPAS